MPGIERHETVIDGIRYKMDTLGAVKGSAVALRILPPFVAAASAALSRLQPGKSLEKLDWSDLAGAAGGVAVLFEKLKEEDLRFVMNALAERTTVGITTEQEKRIGEETERFFPLVAVFDEHFAARYEAMGAWLLWGVQVNGFLGRLSGMLSKMATSPRVPPPAAAAPASTSDAPQASTGSAGRPS